MFKNIFVATYSQLAAEDSQLQNCIKTGTKSEIKKHFSDK